MSTEFADCAAGFPDPFRLLVRESAASTNDEVRALAKSGHPHGLVLLTLEQTAGRGRRGAAWFASAGDSLTFSILVRPEEPQALWPRLALAAGLAVAEAIEPFGAATGIKWPNDVWIARKKTAGILVEAANDCAIVGIGLNVNTRIFPDEVRDIATSIRLETGNSPARADVLSSIIQRFAIRHRQIGNGFDSLLDGVRERCLLTGHRITLKTAAGPLEGTAEGIAPGGELLVRTESGIQSVIQADEVRILP